uniref:Transposase n=1 Tax=Steinernema glaseri TaxID=37863 RepID=A0A1I8AD77_9BILA
MMPATVKVLRHVPEVRPTTSDSKLDLAPLKDTPEDQDSATTEWKVVQMDRYSADFRLDAQRIKHSLTSRLESNSLTRQEVGTALLRMNEVKTALDNRSLVSDGYRTKEVPI